jgi:arylsulfatase A-like enzyme
MTRAVRALDDQVARILDAIDSTGRTQDTLVIYWSDNGYQFGEHRRTWKAAPFEESVHVPMIMRFPAVHPPPSPLVTPALSENVDLTATIADAAGIPWGADGRSLLPILDGSVTSVRDAVLIERCRGTTYLASPCQGQGWYPPSQTTYPAYEGVVSGGYKYVRYPFTHEHQLFDLTNDPYEMTNLADRPDTATLLAGLNAQLNALLAPPVGRPLGAQRNVHPFHPIQDRDVPVPVEPRWRAGPLVRVRRRIGDRWRPGRRELPVRNGGNR